MFSQNKTAFGGGTFGQTGAFGNTFGGANTSTFGAKTTGSSTFGTTSAFGASTPSSTGLFGNTNTQNTSGGGVFGGAANTSFGQNQNTGFGGFGTQPTQGGGLFSSTTQTSNIFGTPTTSSAFGAKPATGSFGTTNQAGGGLFGATSTGGTSLFGGSGTTGGSFIGGASKPAGAFGSNVAHGTVVKFTPPSGTDTVMKGGVSQSINTRHQCITAMKEYESKSLEELRVEDYLSNRKGPQAGAAASGLFGGTQPQAQNTGFGFGQMKTTGFGNFGNNNISTSGGLFGQQPAQAGGSLFGNNANKSLFGTTTTTSSTGFGFGTTTNTSQAGGLFGQQNQQKSIFGTPATQSGTNLFGQTQTSQGFGTSSSGFGFGTNTQTQGGLFNKTGFGTATTNAAVGFGQNTGGLFANKTTTASTGFNFGQATNTGFGAQQTGGGLFGAKAGGFGTATSGLGSTTGFGNLSTGLGTSSSLFPGQQNKSTLGCFPTTNTLGGLGSTSLGGALNLSGTGNIALGGTGAEAAVLVAQQAQIQQQLLALSNSPYGDSPLFRNLKPDENKRDEALKPTNPAAQKAALTAANQYKVNSRPTAKIKPKPLQNLNNKSQLFDGLDEEESSFGNDTFVPRKSIKKLVIKSQRSANNSLVVSPDKSHVRADEDESLVAPSPIMPPSNGPLERSQSEGNTPVVNGDTDKLGRADKSLNGTVDGEPACALYNQGLFDDSLSELNPHKRSDQDRSQRSILGDISEETEPAPPHPSGVKLNRPTYYCLPSLDALVGKLDDDGNCWVEDFVVGRDGYGNVLFPGLTNVAGLNLDEIVHFRRKEITVYPDDAKKPPTGEGLNKKAQVTLDCVWPNDKTTHTPIKSPQRLVSMNYQDKIEQATAKIGAKFIDYRPETGSWVFEVRHFSKYGLLEDSDDENDVAEKDPKRVKMLTEKTKEQLAIQKQKIHVEEGLSGSKATGPPKFVNDKPSSPLAKANGEAVSGKALEEDMEDMLEQPSALQESSEEDDMEDSATVEGSAASHRLAAQLGVSARDVQVMKASFFGEEEDMETERPTIPSHRGLGGKLLKMADSSPLLSRSEGVGLPPSATASPASFARASPSSFTRGSPAAVTRSSPVRQAGSSVLDPSFIYSRVQKRQSAMRPPLKPFQQACPDHIVLPTGLVDSDRSRQLVGSRVHRAVPALEDSIMANKHHMLKDSALLRGRGCRVGWGPGLTLIHCGQPINKVETAPDKPSILPALIGTARRRLVESPYHVVLEKLVITGYSTEADPVLKNMLEKTLEIQLKHSEMTTDNGPPIFTPTPGVASLHRCAEQAQEDEDRVAGHPYSPTTCHTRMVWDLCVALWGRLNECATDEDMDSSSHDHQMARREAFSRWLSATAARKIKDEISDAKVKGHSHIPSVFSHMSGRMVSEACALAQKSGDHRLALLLAQAVGGDVTRRLLTRQLANWQEHKADLLIEPDRLRIYALLAGNMVWPSSQEDINVCENLDWKRCIAIHLWYMCTPTATVAEALALYERAFSGQAPTGRYASLPLPPYLEDKVDKLYAEEEADQTDQRYVVRDTCYHLLKLYADRSHRLERILTPTTSTSNHLDFTLSWHLAQVLQALQYSHLPDYTAANMTASFAAQLEALGLWHWAVFVLLHLQDPLSREHVVRELLGRHVSLSRDADYIDREHFIQERLQVPPAWVHTAKAQRARALRRPADEAWHLLKAGNFNEAHRVLLRHVTSDAIINERHGYLKRYLREMSPSEYSSSIQNWATGGKVFLDYITMIETVDEIKQGDLNVYELERLQPEVTSLCSRIGHLPCHSAKDRLCQSEMAKRTANLLRTLLLLRKTQKAAREMDSSSLWLTQQIAALPLPEDYALQEMRDLTRGFMVQMTS